MKPRLQGYIRIQTNERADLLLRKAVTRRPSLFACTDIRRIELSDGPTSEQPQCAPEVVTQDFQRSRNSCFASGRQSVRIGSSDEDCTRSQAESLYDVATPANAAVH